MGFRTTKTFKNNASVQAIEQSSEQEQCTVLCLDINNHNRSHIEAAALVVGPSTGPKTCVKVQHKKDESSSGLINPWISKLCIP